MTFAAKTRRTVIIEARDLETDVRVRQELDVDAPADAAAQREQLAGVVAEIHPTAKLRSFADGAATFLSPSYLVVAHYDGSVSLEGTQTPVVEQPSLFAA
jgi:hypothetical protein